MNELLLGITGIVVLLVLFSLGLPIAFAMIVVGVVGISYLASPDVGLKFLARDLLDQFTSYNLGTILAFVLMGYYAGALGTGERLYHTVRAWMGQLRGGLALATIGGCAAFAASCGSSVATAGAMGKIAYPEMKRHGYSDTLATGTIAAGGALGTLIPPSNILIIYAVFSEQPIGKLFIAGVIPGIILTGLMMLVVYFMCRVRPEWGPKTPAATWRKRLVSLGGLVDILLLFAVVIGGLAAGWFPPTQGGAIGAIAVLLIGLARRQLRWGSFLAATREGLLTSCMVIFVIAGAIVFGRFMTIANVPMALVESIESSHLSPMEVMIILSLVFFVAGFFMDSMALTVLVVPMILPLLISMGYDLIAFGVVLVILTETGVITPPVGVNVYVLKGIAPEVPIETIFKGALPFVAAMLVLLALVLAFPGIATFLPNLSS